MKIKVFGIQCAAEVGILALDAATHFLRGAQKCHVLGSSLFICNKATFSILRPLLHV